MCASTLLGSEKGYFISCSIRRIFSKLTPDRLTAIAYSYEQIESQYRTELSCLPNSVF